MSMHYDSESLVNWGQSPRLFALLVKFNKQKRRLVAHYELAQN